MALVAMKKVFVLSLAEYKDELVEQLQKMGILQIVDLREKLQEPDWAELLREEQLSDEISHLDIKLSELKFVIDMLGRYEGRKKSFIESFTGSKVPMKKDVFKENVKRIEECDEIYRQCKELDDRINARRNEIANLQAANDALEPWINLDITLSEIGETGHTNSLLGTVEADYLSKLQDELMESAPESYIHVVKEVKKEIFLLISYLNDAEEEVASALRNSSFSRVSFPQLHNTPAESVKGNDNKIQEYQKEIDTLTEKVLSYLDKRDIVLAVYDHLSSERDRLQSVRNFARTDRTFAIEGWIRQEDIDALSIGVSQITDSAAIEVRDATDDEEAPVVLKNHRFIEPFEVITELYAMPISGGFDPTPFLAPFYFLFFGMMLGDIGYGISLSLLCLFLLKKIKMAGLGKKLFEMLFIVGISSAIMGAVTGSFFGDLVPIRPLWFNTTDDPMRMLVVALILGVVQVIYVGLGLRFYINYKRGEKMSAIFDTGSWIIFLTGLFVFFGGPMLSAPVAVVTLGQIMLYTGLLMILLMTARGERNPLKRIGAGLYALYGISGYLGDILSYSRLLALGLASVVVAQVFNTMGYMFAEAGVLGYVIMAVFLVFTHTFNLLINVLGSFVHASRLQFVEFFGKFYDSGGKKFQPFDVTTKYVDLE
jgi:V/A-type H+/Na+-transporting ATPase subunit I